MKICYTERFEKDFKTLSPNIRKVTTQKLRLLEKNVRHPSLRVKKVQKFEGIFEGSINKNFRFLFLITSDSYTLLRIGKHDILEKH